MIDKYHSPTFCRGRTVVIFHVPADVLSLSNIFAVVSPNIFKFALVHIA
jgi:hypothetical protein